MQHRFVNIRFENLRSRRRQADSRRVLLDHLAEYSHLCARVIRLRTHQLTLHTQRFGRIQKPRIRLFPIRQIDIRRHKHIPLRLLMVGLRASGNQRRPRKNRHRHQRCPMSPHWISPLSPILLGGNVCPRHQKILAFALVLSGRFKPASPPPHPCFKALLPLLPSLWLALCAKR